MRLQRIGEVCYLFAIVKNGPVYDRMGSHRPFLVASFFPLAVMVDGGNGTRTISGVFTAKSRQD